ncbi:hypothetical protein TanjilG_13017 [Lupinus angustifolius]|uniref:VQ domain-containing protein n=1 Tax=Lupinus angustifolius TaxID=3871 RepID=A0A1J7GRR1_LUPAN|nr:PREDICTED: calmodulin-binding protein 25-like [Lupinus angustifolius]OIW03223.1 hypothetical protein TanjilG_13017 [Lupinus angustifolius]
MASYENLAPIDSWAFRPTLPDSWLADYIARDAQVLTKALQKSISGNDAVSVLPIFSPLNHDVSLPAPTTSTVSGLSGGSDHESAPKRRAVGATGKISKRKSRASKRSQTTFITADPADFRQMVQQVTGVRVSGSEMRTMAPVLKPEPQRLNGGSVGGVRLPVGAGYLPTLDTSAFLLDHHQQQGLGPNLGTTGFSGPGPVSFGPPIGIIDGSFGTSDIDFDTFSSFPTLESWKLR